MIILHHGRCEHILPTLAENSFDSIVCDPPYGLKFMGQAWDHGVPSAAAWADAYRVLKPGGYLLAFAGSRTYHRMACNIEDAGFEIRDQIMWVYGSGFPKSLDISKPLVGTVAANVLEWGVGGLNIDGCRVATSDSLGGGAEKETRLDQKGNEGGARPWMADAGAQAAHAATVRANVAKAEQLGRFPANLVHDGSDEVLALFPDAAGQQGDLINHSVGRQSPNGIYGKFPAARNALARTDQSTSAARFFQVCPWTAEEHLERAKLYYCAKASKSDRGEGNDHPTVKPRSLMRYLCRLVTPPGGVVLDHYAGSGSTGLALRDEGFRGVLVEEAAHNCGIIRRRLAIPTPEILLPAVLDEWPDLFAAY